MTSIPHTHSFLTKWKISMSTRHNPQHASQSPIYKKRMAAFLKTKVLKEKKKGTRIRKKSLESKVKKPTVSKKVKRKNSFWKQNLWLTPGPKQEVG